MKPQTAPPSIPAMSDSGIGDDRRALAEPDPDDDRPERAHQELALGADVEQAGLERQADGQAAEQQRRGRDERVDDRVEVPTEPLMSAA